ATPRRSRSAGDGSGELLVNGAQRYEHRSNRRGLALLDEEVRAPILRPARLIVVRALRALLSVADDRDAPSGDALGHEVVHRRLRAAFTQCQVVFVGPRSSQCPSIKSRSFSWALSQRAF